MELSVDLDEGHEVVLVVHGRVDRKDAVQACRGGWVGGGVKGGLVGGL